ncbi:hypothetical protein BBH88_01655 [Planococcus antarcticus DSM 14505]|uniref:DUF3817 domain-containing protein n=1 Tax=Planococcus antarcticus DSM 14505 TaxID=1185653 RepID=A0ABM6D1H0_9BACL|nr:DUF3817 domain-containing protein [Planococcus antarcticus]ANU09125.1 hypothetical protein BBH88_01655 [Planococcus antarcticus DSM 14505]
MFKNALRIFRFMGLLEGGSLLILLFIAMPLKYLFEFPEAVSIVGPIHGALFSVYILITIYMTFIFRWPFRFSIGAVASAFLPFGNFILDKRLESWQQLRTSVA